MVRMTHRVFAVLSLDYIPAIPLQDSLMLCSIPLDFDRSGDSLQGRYLTVVAIPFRFRMADVWDKLSCFRCYCYQQLTHMELVA